MFLSITTSNLGVVTYSAAQSLSPCGRCVLLGAPAWPLCSLQVWHATWQGSEVAAKAMSLGHLPKTFTEKIFKGVEMNILGTLNHPHIVHIFRVYCVVGDEADSAVAGDAAAAGDIVVDGGGEEIKEVWIVMVSALVHCAHGWVPCSCPPQCLPHLAEAAPAAWLICRRCSITATCDQPQRFAAH